MNEIEDSDPFYSPSESAESSEVLSDSTVTPVGSYIRVGTENFVSKAKKQRSERIKTIPNDESDIDISEQSKKSSETSLRDTITRDLELLKKQEKKNDKKEDTEEDKEEENKDEKLVPLPTPKKYKSKPKEEESTNEKTKNQKEEIPETSTGSSQTENTEETAAIRAVVTKKKSKKRISKKSYCLTPERVRRPKQRSVAFSPEKPLDILLSPRKLPPGSLKPKKGILKKSISSDFKRQRPKVYLSSRIKSWKLGATKFNVVSKNGLTFVKNPVYNPRDVELRELLEEIYRIHVANGEKAILDVSVRELTSVPSIILKSTYLNVLNLYMNQIQHLPSEIGNETTFLFTFQISTKR